VVRTIVQIVTNLGSRSRDKEEAGSKKNTLKSLKAKTPGWERIAKECNKWYDFHEAVARKRVATG
jgi:hypothetical protein